MWKVENIRSPIYDPHLPASPTALELEPQHLEVCFIWPQWYRSYQLLWCDLAFQNQVGKKWLVWIIKGNKTEGYQIVMKTVQCHVPNQPKCSQLPDLSVNVRILSSLNNNLCYPSLSASHVLPGFLVPLHLGWRRPVDACPSSVKSAFHIKTYLAKMGRESLHLIFI